MAQIAWSVLAGTGQAQDAGSPAVETAGLELTILMPCLNEAETLQVCIEKALDYLKRSGLPGEVVVADNGSTDGSQDIARAAGARVVDVPVRGYGAALIGGCKSARGRFISWILGRLSTATWRDVTLVLPYVVVSSVVLLLHRRHLDVLRVGDDEAAALGTNVRRVRLAVVIAATMGTAAVVSVSGLIGFVGIVVPHLVRLLAGASYRAILPISLLLGATFLILADIPGRILQNPAETPIGVVTAFLGAPFFIIVLRTRRTV